MFQSLRIRIFFLSVFCEQVTFNYFPLYAFMLKRWVTRQVGSHPPSVLSVSTLLFWAAFSGALRSHVITVVWSCLLRPIGTLSVIAYIKRASLCGICWMLLASHPIFPMLNLFVSFTHVIVNFSNFYPTGRFPIPLPLLLNPFSFHQASPCSRVFLCMTHWIWMSCLSVG